jgi:hypothetical protein
MSATAPAPTIGATVVKLLCALLKLARCSRKVGCNPTWHMLHDEVGQGPAYHFEVIFAREPREAHDVSVARVANLLRMT